MKHVTNPTPDKNNPDTRVLYKGKQYTVQDAKGWKHISVIVDGKRKLIGVSSIQKEEILLETLNTVEGWEALHVQYQHRLAAIYNKV